nr:hypothetical protein BaRGS_018789 [Batillaria attramentaria]
MPGSDPCQELAWSGSLPVLLLANQADRVMDRMVSSQEGRQLATELGCVSFTELSVREDIDAVMDLFDDLFVAYRKSTKVKAGGGPLAWSVVSMERLALGQGPREKCDPGGQGVEEDRHDVPLTMGVRTRRQEALIS